MRLVGRSTPGTLVRVCCALVPAPPNEKRLGTQEREGGVMNLEVVCYCLGGRLTCWLMVAARFADSLLKPPLFAVPMISRRRP